MKREYSATQHFEESVYLLVARGLVARLHRLVARGHEEIKASQQHLAPFASYGHPVTADF